MEVIKTGKTIIGAKLTASEKKAMQIEIKKQLSEFNKKNEDEVISLILWRLHVQFGFGAKRLKQFYLDFDTEIKNLVERYDLDNDDDIWLCTKKLNECGIDLEAWKKELKQKGDHHG